MKKMIVAIAMSLLLFSPASYAEAAPNLNSIIKGIGKIFSKKPPSKKVTKYAIGGAALNDATKNRKDKKK